MIFGRAVLRFVDSKGVANSKPADCRSVDVMLVTGREELVNVRRDFQMEWKRDSVQGDGTKLLEIFSNSQDIPYH